ncbi:MAG: ATP-binding cassette domain-containing protein, partial [Desulfobacterales bacterium]|nr:ATP-binding cassette domain-containing protein [Desulfobacterales bacterium]
MGNHDEGPLLAVENLGLRIPTARGDVRAVDGVSFTLEKGKTLAIVGESGCGKSMLCRTLLKLLPGKAFIPGDSR